MSRKWATGCIVILEHVDCIQMYILCTITLLTLILISPLIKCIDDVMSEGYAFSSALIAATQTGSMDHVTQKDGLYVQACPSLHSALKEKTITAVCQMGKLCSFVFQRDIQIILSSHLSVKQFKCFHHDIFAMKLDSIMHSRNR